MIALCGCTLENKAKDSEQLPSSEEKVSQSSIPQENVQNSAQNNSYNINQDKNTKPEPPKEQQPIVQTTFKQGDKGDKVKEIQQKLNKFGYKLDVDGDFGPSTYYAVMDFQMKNNLLQDGKAGELTLEKLDTAKVSESIYKPEVTVSNNEMETFANGKNFPSLTAYFIWIDLPHQKVNIFNGANKNWQLVKSMACSSGKASTPTVKGNFTVGSKGSYFIAEGGVRCKYYTQISGNYLFHSVLYDNAGNNIIDDTLGVPVSHGCVRLALENAKFIYDNIPTGTAIWSN